MPRFCRPNDPCSPASAAHRPRELPRLTRGARQVQHAVRRRLASPTPQETPNCQVAEREPHLAATAIRCSASSCGAEKFGAWLVFIEKTFWTGMAVYMAFCTAGGIALSARHST